MFANRAQNEKANMTWRQARYLDLLDFDIIDFDTPGGMRQHPTGPRLPLPFTHILGGLRQFLRESTITRTSRFSRTSGNSRSNGNSSLVDAVTLTRSRDPTFSAAVEESKIAETDLSAGPFLQQCITRHNQSGSPGKWDWVKDHDELIHMMKQGSVFYGFVEAPITFPSSFKWNPYGCAGDFTDIKTLAGQPYD
jgi:hypothetical protein